MTPLQREIMVILQASKNQGDGMADLETLENIFIDTLTDRTVILTALNKLITRGYLKEERGGWLLTDAGATHSPALSS